jgi:hypothetical protein
MYYYRGDERIAPVITDSKAVLLAPCGASAKHGKYYSSVFTLFNGNAIVSLPE